MGIGSFRRKETSRLDHGATSRPHLPSNATCQRSKTTKLAEGFIGERRSTFDVSEEPTTQSGWLEARVDEHFKIAG
ncbi:hypothetical protein [Xaviernesmea oryzae]|uniref:hypothetical protein n=1 Tax=Xaviernesmea oryzae TaxID=464029 RepID=UPI0011144ED8|nr:hypothetical protein [Xaviernesmea oryzae]